AVVLLEDVGEILHARVTTAERREAIAPLEGGEDRRGVVRSVIDDEGPPQVWRHDEGGDPRARTPLIVRSVAISLARRRDAVPRATELVVRHDDHGVPGAGALLNGVDEGDQVVAAVRLVRVAGMLVLGADRLHKAHGLQLALRVRGRGQL